MKRFSPIRIFISLFALGYIFAIYALPIHSIYVDVLSQLQSSRIVEPATAELLCVGSGNYRNAKKVTNKPELHKFAITDPMHMQHFSCGLCVLHKSGFDLDKVSQAQLFLFAESFNEAPREAVDLLLIKKLYSGAHFSRGPPSLTSVI